MVKKAVKDQERRLCLAMSFRRAVFNQRARDEKAAAVQERKAEVGHKKRMARRDRTDAMAAERISDCKRYPSPHAVEQLGGIAGDVWLNASNRVEAAATLLDMGHLDPTALAEKRATEQAAKRRPRAPKFPGAVAERLRSR